MASDRRGGLARLRCRTIVPAFRAIGTTARRPSESDGRVGCPGSRRSRCVFRAIDKVSGGSRPATGVDVPTDRRPPSARRRAWPAQLKRPVTSIPVPASVRLTAAGHRPDRSSGGRCVRGGRSGRPSGAGSGARRSRLSCARICRPNAEVGRVRRRPARLRCPTDLDAPEPGAADAPGAVLPRRPNVARVGSRSGGQTRRAMDRLAGPESANGPIPLLPIFCSGRPRA